MCGFIKIWVPTYLVMLGLLAAHRKFYLKEAFSIELPIITLLISPGIAKILFDLWQ